MVTTDIPPIADDKYTIEFETPNIDAPNSARPAYPMK